MPRVLEETTSREIERDHIVRRVDDWALRIDALYEQVTRWLPSGWTANRDGTIHMREELMQKFSVAPRELPMLKLSYLSHPLARIEPRGLWIIGANGRLDFFSRSGHYIIIDTAENFGTSDWHIAPLSNGRSLQPLNRDTFVEAL
jgi:hypothetical protein